MEESSTVQKIKDEKSRKRSNFNTESDPILFLHLLRRNLLWFIAIIAITVSSVLVYLRYTEPVYESSLTFQVGSVNTANQVLNMNDFHESNDLAKDIEVLKSKLLFRRALQRLPLEVTYFNKGEILDHEMYKSSPIKIEYANTDHSLFGKVFFIKFLGDNRFSLMQNTKSKGEYKFGEDVIINKAKFKVIQLGSFDKDVLINEKEMYFVFNNIDDLTNSYIDRLSVFSSNPSAKTINISFQDNNPEKCADVASAVAEEYIVYDIEERRKSSKKALGFIDDQLDKYYNKVKKSENSIQDFQKDNKFSNIDRSTVYFDRNNKLENELIDLDLQISVLSEVTKKISLDSEDIDVYDLLPILAGTDYAVGIMSLITNLKELLVIKENMRYNVTKDSETIKLLDHKIEVQKKILVESIASSTNKLIAKRNDLLVKVESLEKEFLGVPIQELEYARLQRILSIDEKFFTLLMEKRTEYSISDAGFVSQHTVLSEAVVPSLSIYPNKKLFILFGVMAGLVLSLIMLLVIYLLKNTISSIDDIIWMAYSEVTILGIVPRYKKNIPVSQLVVNKNPKSIIAESFRAIRSNMQFISNEPGKKILAVTSTISGEGKTFCAINIAGIVAFSGKKVVILDLDMRKPKIHLGFGVENNVGMSTLLIDEAKIDDCIKNSEQEGLDFITSGPVPPNPSELIINGKLDIIIEELKQVYDFVIIDNPPIGLVSDAMEVLKKADFPIYVFKNEYSKKYFVSNVDRLVLDNGIKKLSLILNSVEVGSKSYGGGYGYGYGGGYGYGYGYGYGGYYDDGPDVEKSRLSKIFNR